MRVFVATLLSLQLLRQPLKPISGASWADARRIRMLPSEAKKSGIDLFSPTGVEHDLLRGCWVPPAVQIVL